MPDPTNHQAWYASTRQDFLAATTEGVANQLAGRAASDGWHIHPDQVEEWRSSVDILRQRLSTRPPRQLAMLNHALQEAGSHPVDHVVLEYDLRRRGLRMDCVLLAPGAILVVEFKREAAGAASRDQVTNYCINLVEFHHETRRLVREHGFIVVPILARTNSGAPALTDQPLDLRVGPWAGVLRRPLACDRSSLGEAIALVLKQRRSQQPINSAAWLGSLFHPSSTIVDAAISLYGHHEVSAIREHAAPSKHIANCTGEIVEQVLRARATRRNRIVFLSGAPGAGKTLVGLNLAFEPRFRADAVFVTGNSPLVRVLEKALQQSYRASKPARGLMVESGYPLDDVRHVIDNSTFKIVKAHRFLDTTTRATGAADGRLVVFDEAQRTYVKGRSVARQKLEDHEADLILQSLERSYNDGIVLVALLGQNQAINRGERGAVAWFEAAERFGWEFSIGDDTLALPELRACGRDWAKHPLRLQLEHGHLHHSMRFYRNEGLERWAHHLMTDNLAEASREAATLAKLGHAILVTRDLARARTWARAARVGEERSGIIASGQARRLAAFGLHVDLKPDIAAWMLAPTGDFRSSNALETVQNQYQIQGLEVDWAIVCWGADLRRPASGWQAFKLSGGAWQNDNALEIAKNGYRVLLTRARKGMVIFVPEGDRSGDDPTREPDFFDGVYEHLLTCGAHDLEHVSDSIALNATIDDT